MMTMMTVMFTERGAGRSLLAETVRRSRSGTAQEQMPTRAGREAARYHVTSWRGTRCIAQSHKGAVAALAMLLPGLILILSLSGCDPAPGVGPGPGEPDQRPTFGSVTLPSYAFDTSYPHARELPAATGGDGTLTYTLTPDIPGMTFSSGTRTLSGTPGSVGEYAMTYTATDADGDAATLRFTAVVISLSDGEYLRAVLTGADGGTIMAAGVKALDSFDDATISAVLDADLSLPMSELIRATPAVGEILMALARAYDMSFPAVSVELSSEVSSRNSASTAAPPPIRAGLLVSTASPVVVALRGTAAIILGMNTGAASDFIDCTFEAIGSKTALEEITDGDLDLTDTQRRLAGCLETFRRHSPVLRLVAEEHDLSATGDDRRNREVVTTAGLTRIDSETRSVARELPVLIQGVPFDLTPHFEELSIHALRKTLSQANYVANRSRIDLQLPAATGGDMPLTYRLTPEVPGLQQFINERQLVECRRDNIAFCKSPGSLIGIPTVAGVYQMNFRVTDADGDTDQFTFTIYVNDPLDQRPTFDSTTVGRQAYLQGVAITPLVLPEAMGGNPPLTYSLIPNVPGLQFDTGARTLTGMPTTTGTYDMTYQVTDVDGDLAEILFPITVINQPTFEGLVGQQTYEKGVAITPLVLPEAIGGTPPLTYSLTPDVPGLQFDPGSRTLSGTPTTKDTYSMTYRVEDSEGNTDDILSVLSFTITVTDELGHVAVIFAIQTVIFDDQFQKKSEPSNSCVPPRWLVAEVKGKSYYDEDFVRRRRQVRDDLRIQCGDHYCASQEFISSGNCGAIAVADSLPGSDPYTRLCPFALSFYGTSLERSIAEVTMKCSGGLVECSVVYSRCLSDPM